MTCDECGSTNHFASNCPHRKVEETNMAMLIALVARKADSWSGSMLVESLGKVILHCAYTKAVSGEEWINDYIENLNEENKK